MPLPADSALGALMAMLPRPGVVRWIGLRPARDEAMRECEAVEAIAGKGLLGDRYASASGKRGITLIQAEHLPVIAALAGLEAVSPATLKRYLDILQALYIVFIVQPWHRNIGRAILQTPKVYFFDTGLVRGDEGVRFENAVATMLLKHVHFRQDARGKAAGLHYIRTKDGAEVDFALSEENRLTHLLECKVADAKPHAALARFAREFPDAEAVQVVKHLRQEEHRSGLRIARAADWLRGLEA